LEWALGAGRRVVGTRPAGVRLRRGKAGPATARSLPRLDLAHAASHHEKISLRCNQLRFTLAPLSTPSAWMDRPARMQDTFRHQGG
jgi:hypothetical protein